MRLSEEQSKVLDHCPPAPIAAGAHEEEGNSNQPQHQQHRPGDGDGGSGSSGSSGSDGHIPGRLVVVTAAAGTGKTTALEALAVRARELGHERLVYLTFNRAAADEGKARMDLALLRQQQQQRDGSDNNRPPRRRRFAIEAKTLHSCAISLLNSTTKQQQNGSSSSYRRFDPSLNDRALKDRIGSICRREIDRHVRYALDELEAASKTAAAARGTKSSSNNKNKPKSPERAREFVRQKTVLHVLKVLVAFCHSDVSEDDFRDCCCSSKNDNQVRWTLLGSARHYHRTNGEKDGFPPKIYSQENRLGFYAASAFKVWSELRSAPRINFDMLMKLAQLQRLPIPGSLLLIDESQDMNACQIDWVVRQQVARGTHAFVVGDAAQSIYAFRGARPDHLMELRSTHACSLTRTFRFGEHIRRIANLVLYCKDRSPQIWDPYRIVAGGSCEGEVTTQPLFPRLWKERKVPVTVIARQNATLFKYVIIDVLGFKMKPDAADQGEGGDGQQEGEVGNEGVPCDRVVTQTQSDKTQSTELPKIYINGKGKNSGANKFEATLKQVKYLYRQLYCRTDGVPVLLDCYLFPEYKGQEHTWSSFEEDCAESEISPYLASVNIILLFQKRTLEVILLFEKQVMDPAATMSEAEADIVLTTAHSSKGLEWDNVEVLDDFIDLCQVSRIEPPISSGDRKRKADDPVWGFSFTRYGDELNLLYVACTRAKKVLSVRSNFGLLRDMDLLHFRWQSDLDSIFGTADGSKEEEDAAAAETRAPSLLSIFGYEKGLSDDDLERMYYDIVAPFRSELGLTGDESMEAHLLGTLPSSNNNNNNNNNNEEEDAPETVITP